jgi:hypothetical protein
MNLRTVIERSLRRSGAGHSVAGTVNKTVAAKTGESGRSTYVSHKQRIVQREGRTAVTTEEQEVKGGTE